jgi:hypothetical protein
MNGEQLYKELHKDLIKLDKNFAKLETLMDEKWKNHNLNSEQQHKENLKKFDELFERWNKLPCDKRAGFYTYAKWHLRILTAIVLGMLFKVFLVK